jgi:tetratricopeptide (TPR) repeat protein
VRLQNAAGDEEDEQVTDVAMTKEAVIARALELADAHAANGRIAEMEQVCRQLLAEFPDCADAWNRLGIIMAERGNGLQALACMERAMGIAPLEPSYHANLGEIMRRAGLHQQALTHCMRALELGPNHLAAHLNLGYALLDSGRAADALGHFELVTVQERGNAKAWYGLGSTLAASGQPDAAAEALARVVALAPSDAEAWMALARVHLALDDFAGAMNDAQRAVALRPDLVNAITTLADVLLQDGQITDAEYVLRDALQSAAGSAPMRYRLALCCLERGDYREGFSLFEARFDPGMANCVERAILPMPMWTGEDLSGGRLLVLTEQGYGDHLQFCRFIGRLAANGIEVVLGASPPMRDLMLTLQGCSRVQTLLDEARSSGCDYWTFVGSLPHRLGVEADAVESAGPYLFANPGKRAAWRERLAQFSPNRRIGLVWAGRPTHHDDRRRSIPFAKLAALAAAKDVTWISVQTGPQAADAVEQANVLHVERFAEEFASFDDTAALIAELDLLISVDTAPAHLAGALGCPVWTLLPKVADWRWSLGDEATPWYPGMRLFRQQSRGDWDGVIQKVVAELNADAAR